MTACDPVKNRERISSNLLELQCRESIIKYCMSLPLLGLVPNRLQLACSKAVRKKKLGKGFFNEQVKGPQMNR